MSCGLLLPLSFSLLPFHMWLQHATIRSMHPEQMIASPTEAMLVDEFVTLLRSGLSPWGGVGILQEFGYQRGKTDVVITTENATIAFEAKLNKWRIALDQAYRNTCFAQQSYVLLPLQRALLVRKYAGEFEERGIGLCCLNNGQLEVLLEPSSGIPVEPWLTAHARNLADS